VVGIAFQDDVKSSFSKVKNDMLNIKRSLNRELLAIEEVSGRIQTLTSKDEFYSFIKRLGERLDKIETSLETYLALEDDIKNTDAKLKSVFKKLSRQEDLSSEVREVRKLKGKVSALEGSSVNVQKFNDEVTKLDNAVSSIKKVMLTDKDFETAKSKVSDLNKHLASLEKTLPSKEDVFKNLETLRNLRQGFEKHKRDTQTKLDENLNKLKKDVEGIRDASVGKDLYNQKTSEIKKDLNTLKNLVDSSVSEIDLSDYVTKKEFGKNFSKVDEINSEIEKLSSSASNTETHLKSLKNSAASLSDVENVHSDVKDVKKSVDRLNDTVKKLGEVSQKHFEQQLNQVSMKLERDISKLKADFEEKIKKTTKEKKVYKPGLLSKVGKGMSDFFKEEEPEKVEKEKKAKTWSVSEFLKDEQKKKSKTDDRAGGFIIISAVILLLLLVGLFFYFSAYRDISDTGQEAAITTLDVVKTPQDEVTSESDAETKKIEKGNVTETRNLTEPLAAEEALKVNESSAEEEPLAEVTTNLSEDVMAEEQKNVTQQEVRDLTEPAQIDEEIIEITSSESIDKVETLPEVETEETISPELDEQIDIQPEVETVESCQERYECKIRAENEYWFDCYVDENSQCRCFVTDAEGCDIVEELSEEELEVEGGGLRSNRGYLVVAGVVLVIMLAIFLLTIKPPKSKPKEPKKRPAKDSLDLEEFFEKK